MSSHGLLEAKKRHTLLTCPPHCCTFLVSRCSSLPHAASENERAHRRFLSTPLPVEIFHLADPITGGELGGHLVEHIISHAGAARVQMDQVTTRFLPVL